MNPCTCLLVSALTLATAVEAEAPSQPAPPSREVVQRAYEALLPAAPRREEPVRQALPPVGPWTGAVWHEVLQPAEAPLGGLRPVAAKTAGRHVLAEIERAA